MFAHCLLGNTFKYIEEMRYRHFNKKWRAEASCIDPDPQALVSFKKYMSHPLPYFKVNICPLPLPHFASIFFAYL
jgi:hypothetical protein